MDRRCFLKCGLLGSVALTLPPMPLFAAGRDGTEAQLNALEHKRGGRLGVAVHDTESGQHFAHRGDQKFLMCSTFKLLAAGAVLARVDCGDERLDRRVAFGKDVVLSYAPVTSQRVGGPGMTIGELCEAAITVSDNTAANLLLRNLGGPAAVTAFARRLGDTQTRLDRVEPDLNVGSPGDMRDTTTPQAMLGNLHALLLGNALSSTSRAQLAAWLQATTTGKDTLRAGIPADWRAGDKTGRGSHGETNDVAILLPPQRKPLLIAAYYVNPDIDDDARSRVLAEVARMAVAGVTG